MAGDRALMTVFFLFVISLSVYLYHSRGTGCPRSNPSCSMDARVSTGYESSLFVCIGRLRGGEDAWRSFASTLPPGSSVALFLGEPNQHDERVFARIMKESHIPIYATWYSGEPHGNNQEFFRFERPFTWGDLLPFGNTW
jgi:hypothetical protein